jgi:hypothetical protein
VIPQRGYLDHTNGGTIDVDINVFGPIAPAGDLDLLLSVMAGPEPERAMSPWRLTASRRERSLADLDVGVVRRGRRAIDSEYATTPRDRQKTADAGMRCTIVIPTWVAKRSSSKDDDRWR